MAFTSNTLEDDLKALEGKLNGSQEDDGDLKKALADVAKGAIGLATKTLSKARGDDDDMGADEDEGDDDRPGTDDDDTEEWIQNLLQNKGGEPAQKSRRQEWGGEGLYKALSADSDVGAVDVGGYLQEELAIRERDRKELRRLRKQNGLLLKAITDLHASSTANSRAQQRVNAVLAKGLMKLLDATDDLNSQPATGSRFALMEKSVSAARDHLRTQGGQEVKYTKDHAVRLLQKGIITQEQHRIWKTTNMLPPGIDAA
jgi:hypothetical protein